MSNEAAKSALQKIMKKAVPSVKFGGGDGPLTSTSTGSLALDRALGCWGFPHGRIIEIFGPESSGKTALALSCIRQHQREGKMGAYIETEQAYDAAYTEALGVDTSILIHPEADDNEPPLTGEEYLDLALAASGTPEVGIVVLDSVVACVPKAELEGDMDDQQVGLQARMFGKFMRKVVAELSRTGNTLVLVNQVREKIGVKFGSPETTPAGRAIKFASSQRVRVSRVETIKSKGEAVGINVKANVIKNKCGAPFLTAEFPIRFGYGVDGFREILTLGTDLKLVDKAGAWYSYKGERLGCGFDASLEALAATPERYAELKAAVVEQLKSGAIAITSEED